MEKLIHRGDQSKTYIKRDAYSLKEVADYIAGVGVGNHLNLGPTVGLEPQENCPGREAMIDMLRPGDKVLIQKRRAANPTAEYLPSGVILSVEELRDSGLRFQFLCRVT
jgi:hypothetical protein